MQSRELPLAMVVHRQDRRAVLALHGELDLATLPRLAATVDDLRQGSPSPAIDARALGFVDVRGLRYLERLEGRAVDEDWTVELLRGPALERLSTLVEGRQPRRSPPVSLTLTARPVERDGGEARFGALSVMVTPRGRARPRNGRGRRARRRHARPCARRDSGRRRLRPSMRPSRACGVPSRAIERQPDDCGGPVDSLTTQDLPVPAPLLTARQLEILQLVAEGRSTEEIARTLWLSAATVRNHIARTLRALGAHSRVEAVATARRARLLA